MKIKINILIILVLLSSSCQADIWEDLKKIIFHKQEKQVNNKKETVLDKNSTEYKAYMAQEHRFALNGCELTYNEKPFYIGMPLEEARKLFGKETRSIYSKKNATRKLWSDMGLRLIFIDFKIAYIHIFIEPISIQKSFYDKLETKMIGNKYVIFHNQLLSQTQKMQDFIKSTDLVFFDTLGVDTYGYTKIYQCQNRELSYILASEVYREALGSGHLMFSGDWRMNETNPIDYISIRYKTKEESSDD